MLINYLCLNSYVDVPDNTEYSPTLSKMDSILLSIFIAIMIVFIVIFLIIFGLGSILKSSVRTSSDQ